MASFKVLIVDDAGLIRDLIRKALRTQFPNWQISEEINGLKARQVLKKTDFDLILCDWEMPEMSGSELLSWFRSEHGGTTPFIMVTSRGDKAHVVEAIQSGVSNYLVKPFNNQQLIDKISTTLTKQGIKMDQHRKATPVSSMNSSVSALTGGGSSSTPRKPPSPSTSPASGSIDVLTQSRTSQPPATSKNKEAKRSSGMRASCSLRLSNEETLKCAIRNATLKAISLVASADTHIPALLEQAVVDIEVEPGEFARINGFIQGLKTGQPHPTPETVEIAFQIVDDDGVKLAQLSTFIAANR